MSAGRICYVVPTLGAGGTERQLLELMRSMAPEYDVIVVCTRTDGAWAGNIRRVGKVVVLHLRSGWDPRAERRLYKAFRMYRPDVVHSFMFGFDYAVNKAARAAGVPVVISSRRQLADWKKPRHIRLQKQANALVDAIVANSRAVAEFAAQQEGESLDRYTVIYNGIDAERFVSDADDAVIRRRHNIPPDKQVVGMVANFSPVKDHTLFVQMASLLRKHRDDVHFVLVGSGPLASHIERQLKAKGLADHTTMLTTISELPDLYRIFAVKVLTSRSEGLPNVVMEAMASGTPVVAAAVGGIPEIIEDGVTGALVNSRDPQAFADAVECYLNDAVNSEAIGQAAADSVRQHFSIERMASGYRALYAELLQKKGDR